MDIISNGHVPKGIILFFSLLKVDIHSRFHKDLPRDGLVLITHRGVNEPPLSANRCVSSVSLLLKVYNHLQNTDTLTTRWRDENRAVTETGMRKQTVFILEAKKGLKIFICRGVTQQYSGW